jgi:hypothetical protein|tara:strand:- start:1174 stop:2184 length:1011 start_codon:yes stop_codon:yes gene_type:complete
MALWGNNDAVVSIGTVSLDYSTGVVTGSGTTFGTAGNGVVGDVIRFGTRIDGTYFGDAVIVSVANTQSCTIGSTEGLSGVAIAGTDFTVSQLPKYTILDRSYSDNPLANHESPSINTLVVGSAAATAAVGSTCVPVFNGTQLLGGPFSVKPPLQAGDFVVNDGNNIKINRVGSAVTAATVASGVGTDIILAVAPAGTVVGDTITVGNAIKAITAIGGTNVSIASTIDTLIAAGSPIVFTGDNLINLDSAITAQITSGDQVTFKRLHKGYDKYAYAVSEAETEAVTNNSYKVAHGGWVGVTTYIDTNGNYRVKSEVLVAMSGITTGSERNNEFPPNV